MSMRILFTIIAIFISTSCWAGYTGYSYKTKLTVHRVLIDRFYIHCIAPAYSTGSFKGNASHINPKFIGLESSVSCNWDAFNKLQLETESMKGSISEATHKALQGNLDRCTQVKDRLIIENAKLKKENKRLKKALGLNP